VKPKPKRFEDLVNLIALLRAPGGCPWDRKQTHRSILPNLIEETYELVESIEKNNLSEIKEELGDLLLQVVFHAQMEAEKKNFDISDVITQIHDKIVLRHPHVFKKKTKLSTEKVLQNWEKIKLSQKKESHSALSGLPKHLPALVKAYRMQEKISRLGFEWSKKEEVLAKIEEELKELKMSLKNKNSKKIEEELGDLFLILVTLARKLKKDPELALRRAIDQFIVRFSKMEKITIRKNRKLSDLSTKEMNDLLKLLI
jgi:tetrapyrrole methylase family protein / MazG family protein